MLTEFQERKTKSANPFKLIISIILFDLSSKERFFLLIKNFSLQNFPQRVNKILWKNFKYCVSISISSEFFSFQIEKSRYGMYITETWVISWQVKNLKKWRKILLREMLFVFRRVRGGIWRTVFLFYVSRKLLLSWNT